MPPTLALAEPAQAAEIAALAARTFPLACPDGMPATDIAAFVAAQLSPERFGAYIADPARRVALALADGKIVGYTMLVLGIPAPEIAGRLGAMPTAELSKIYVDPEHHGGSAATLLLGDALAGARLAERAGVWLGTNQANVRAQRFYAKHGFAQVGTRRFHVGTRWESDFIYERRL